MLHFSKWIPCCFLSFGLPKCIQISHNRVLPLTLNTLHQHLPPPICLLFFLFFCFLLIQTHAVQIAVRKEANTKNINVNGSGDKKTKQAYSTKKWNYKPTSHPHPYRNRSSSNPKNQITISMKYATKVGERNERKNMLYRWWFGVRQSMCVCVCVPIESVAVFFSVQCVDS